jgi:uncharacterized membrane protein
LPHSLILDLLRILGGGVCHQLPERSLQVAGTTLPLCARCTGTYLGALVGLLTVVLRHRTRASLLPRWPVLALFAAFFLWWGVDGLNSLMALYPGLPHLYEPSNTLRVLTGTLQGLTLSLILWSVVGFALWRQPRAEPVVGLGELGAAALIAGLLVALLSLDLPGLLFAAGVLSALGLLSLFTLLNALLLALVLRLERKIDDRRQAMALFGGASLLAAAELVLLSLLRHRLLGF